MMLILRVSAPMHNGLARLSNGKGHTVEWQKWRATYVNMEQRAGRL